MARGHKVLYCANLAVLSFNSRCISHREHIVDVCRDSFTIRYMFKNNPGAFWHGQENHAGLDPRMQANPVHNDTFSNSLLFVNIRAF